MLESSKEEVLEISSQNWDFSDDLNLGRKFESVTKREKSPTCRRNRTVLSCHTSPEIRSETISYSYERYKINSKNNALD